MIKEAIQFVEDFEENQSNHPQSNEREEWKGKKFIIVKTKEDDNGNLEYDNSEKLENDETIREGIEKNKHYREFMNQVRYYIFPHKNFFNKTRRGLSSATPLAFKLSDANLGNFKNKIGVVKNSYPQSNLISSIFDVFLKEYLSEINNNEEGIFKSFYPDKKYKEGSNSLNAIILVVSLPKDEFNELFNLTQKYTKENLRNPKKNQGEVNGECYVCRKINNCSPISAFFSANADDKLFLKHRTREGSGASKIICGDCEEKLKSFEKILKDKKIKIFPLFINSSLQKEAIKILNEEGENKFALVFEDIYARQREKRPTEKLDFYLFVKPPTEDYPTIDYITNYSWFLGDLRVYFNNLKLGDTTYEKGDEILNQKRTYIEIEVLNILGGKLDYFDKLKGDDNKQINLKYKIRQKLFDFVYRNKKSLSKEDIGEIVIYRIEKGIMDGKIYPDEVRRFLNFLFNINLLGEKMETPIIERVKEARSYISNGNYEKINIEDDGEWAYWMGQISYFLVYQSKQDKKKFNLLEPFINKSNPEQLKRTLIELFERYKHEIDLSNMKFREIAQRVLSFQTKSDSFSNLKQAFYVGVFDDNIFLNKREQSNTGENEHDE